MQKTPYQVIDITQKLKDGMPSSRRFKVRAILKWFGAKRRGDAILAEIQSTLAKYGLTTVPAFDKPGIDDFVRFALASVPDGDSSASNAAGAAEAVEEPISLSEPKTVEGLIKAAAEEAEVALAPSEDQLEPENGDEPPIVKPDDHPVTSQICDWTISALTDKLDRGQLALQPKFQREYVWSLRPELPSRLIESLLLKIPIPPIYFGKVPGGSLEVIDGQQRLTTLVRFVRNEFTLRKLQRMSSLNGKLFKELTKEQQEKILDEPIRTIVIDAAGNTELRYEIFERLNRGSMALNEQELRNCVYRGPFNDLLAELERDSYWRKVKGGTDPEWRFKEREMILRFFAFANRLPQYGGNLKAFLNEYMGQYAPHGDAALKAHATLFRQTMQNVYAVFGPNSARLTPINVSRYHRLGGGDIDRAIIHEVLLPQLLEQNGLDQHALGFEEKRQRVQPALLAVAEALKQKLSIEILRLKKFGRWNGTDKATLVQTQPGAYPVELKDRTLTLQSPKLSALDFEKVLAPFLDRDLLMPREDEYRVSCSIFAPLEDALTRSRLDRDEIDICLLAGGSSLIPQVAEAVGEYFTEARILTFPSRDDTQTAIAKGAALHALSLALTGRAMFQSVCHDEVCFQTNSGPVELVPRGAELHSGIFRKHCLQR
jgi:hypothetical protein